MDMSDNKDDEYPDTQVGWLVFGLLGALAFTAVTVMNLRAGGHGIGTFSSGAMALMMFGYSVRAVWRLFKRRSRGSHNGSDGAA